MQKSTITPIQIKRMKLTISRQDGRFVLIDSNGMVVNTIVEACANGWYIPPEHFDRFEWKEGETDWNGQKEYLVLWTVNNHNFVVHYLTLGI